MRSTALVAMKLSFGAKPGRFCLRSTIWIAASHRREGGVSLLAVNKHSQESGARSQHRFPTLAQGSKDHVSDHLPRHRRVNDFSSLHRRRIFAAVAELKLKAVLDFKKSIARRIM
jgi:hypothetical protein